MASKVTTQVTELPESRVRVDAEVSAEAVDKEVARAASTIGERLKVPGFRGGKVPAPVVIQRVGSATVIDQAVRDALPGWYREALLDAMVSPIGDPKLDFDSLPRTKESFQFSIEVGTRPKAKLKRYKGLEVPAPEVTVEDAAVDTELERLRKRLAKLENTDDAAANGSHVLIDFEGFIDGEPFSGGSGRDQLLELGSNRFIPGFEEGLVGLQAGESKDLEIEFPSDYGAEDLAGKAATFKVTVKEVKKVLLPEVDEEFALSMGFDSPEELRSNIVERLTEVRQQEADRDFRLAILDAAVDNATVSVPQQLATARAKENLSQTIDRLGHRGIDRASFFKISGKSEEQWIEEGTPDAEREIKREAVLSAIVIAESIDPTDEELLEELAANGPPDVKPKKLLEQLKSAGRIADFVEEVSQRAALDLIVESSQGSNEGKRRGVKKLWTPSRRGEDSEEPPGE